MAGAIFEAPQHSLCRPIQTSDQLFPVNAGEKQVPQTCKSGCKPSLEASGCSLIRCSIWFCQRCHYEHPKSREHLLDHPAIHRQIASCAKIQFSTSSHHRQSIMLNQTERHFHLCDLSLANIQLYQITCMSIKTIRFLPKYKIALTVCARHVFMYFDACETSG